MISLVLLVGILEVAAQARGMVCRPTMAPILSPLNPLKTFPVFCVPNGDLETTWHFSFRKHIGIDVKITSRLRNCTGMF